MGSALDDLVKRLHETYNVRFIYVCQTLMRKDKLAFNRKAKKLTKYLRVVLEPVAYAKLWGNSGFWRPSQDFYLPDGVHLNS